MKKLDWALAHAAAGFWVFQIVPNGKTPLHKGWQQEATRDPSRIRNLWTEEPDANIGAFTGRFMEDGALLVVDVDNKGNVRGDETLFSIEDAGEFFKETYENRTPTGGRHIVYSCAEAVKQGAGVLGSGLDIRSRGGYIVMAGSEIAGKRYTAVDRPIATSPGWLYSKLLLRPEMKAVKNVDQSRLDPALARGRCERYLETAPSPQEGQRNETAYKVACQFKDLGADEDLCFEMMNLWNADLEEPLEEEELAAVSESAYQHAQNDRGAKAAETYFNKVEKTDDDDISEADPVLALNKNYALVLAGGSHHIVWETTDHKGNFKLEHVQEPSFHKMLASYTMTVETEKGNKQVSISRLWINHPGARRYKGFCFMPELETPEGFYNLWRGFAVKPLAAGEKPAAGAQDALDKFLEHNLMNVCDGDRNLFKWLMGFYAHMVQRPWEKPLVAVVFKGGKGVGKNTPVEIICSLFGSHAVITDNRRYLISNFNSHMERCLALVLDEAFWSGEKDIEGILKGLITGGAHNIERKGKEMYSVDNLLRVFIIGNEHWLVPASHDERRFAVFDVGDGRKKDRKFFRSMLDGMKNGGNRLLLTYLMNYDLSGIDVDEAPDTAALMEQKLASLEPMAQWWFSCISDGILYGTEFGASINFMEIETKVFRRAFSAWFKDRNIRARLPDDGNVGRLLKAFAPSLKRIRKRQGKDLMYCYQGDGLEKLRADWEKYIGSKIKWEPHGELECLS